MAQDIQKGKDKNLSTRPPVLPRPLTLPAQQIVDPELDTYNVIYNYVEMDPSTIEYPMEKSNFLRDLPLPFPPQWRYLMLNSAISGITQLPESVLLNPDWATG